LGRQPTYMSLPSRYLANQVRLLADGGSRMYPVMRAA
jgi:hypothetical protein